MHVRSRRLLKIVVRNVPILSREESSKKHMNVNQSFGRMTGMRHMIQILAFTQLATTVEDVFLAR